MLKIFAQRNYERVIDHVLGDFMGKKKSITSAYKKQQSERELWKQEEE